MGQEITSESFQQEHFDRFRQHLESEMDLLRQWFSGHKFADDTLQGGLELEAWLVGLDGLPVPDNRLFLATLDRRSVVPELSKFNFELNVSPQYLRGTGLRDMQSELRATWMRCEDVAQKLNHRIVSIGILPTVKDSMLCLENMSCSPRYAALNEQVLRLREGQPLHLKIEGEDQLSSLHHDLMLESAATSVQIHTKVPQRSAVRYYNSSVIVSALTVATAANASLLFGKRLWHDTRIPVFEQSVDTAGPRPRVSFGSNYVADSLLELFEQNLTDHRILLPAEREEPPSKIPYVRMHNGTVWNWNRPLIGFEPDGRPHLRIEHRPMSASPSIADLFADFMLYVGLMEFLAQQPTAPETQLPFEDARKNFYQAAQHGLSATIRWIDGRHYVIADLLQEQLVERAVESLHALGLQAESILEGQQVLRGRLATRQNGAAWQRRKFAEYDGDLQQLQLDYQQQQALSRPIHEWH